MRGKARHGSGSATGDRHGGDRSPPPRSAALPRGAGLLASASTAALAAEIRIPFIDRTVTVPDIPAGSRHLSAASTLHNAYLALFLGLVAFSATTAVLLVREQRRSARRTRALRSRDSGACEAPTISPPC